MNKLMKRLSWGPHKRREMLREPHSDRQLKTRSNLNLSFDNHSKNEIDLDELLSLQTTSLKLAPLPPHPPPRRRKKQKSIFYDLTDQPLHANTPLNESLSIVNASTSNTSSTAPPIPPPIFSPIPPPIPPRTFSIEISNESVNESTALKSDEFNTQLEHNLFSGDELIQNLMQHLQVMEELNDSLRTELRSCRDQNDSLINELAAVNLEREQLLQTCKEIDELKENEWLCSICLDDRHTIMSSSRQVVSTHCGHLFCNVCINMVLDAESVCPTCRKSIPPKKPAFHFLYF